MDLECGKQHTCDIGAVDSLLELCHAHQGDTVA